MCGSKMKGIASVRILKTTGGAFKPFPIGTGEKPQLRLKVRDKHLGCGPLTRSLKDWKRYLLLSKLNGKEKDFLKLY
ncbi:hypothetical protein JEQ12_013540 [Ovis aries]|uniref:Uncharacterized protein n=1 Tax=Ovis aries TaxID=9940 RepID=A0A836AJQ6_SHEEP|nr:hypothetical protein JEQ12_013540 [Ovis aries]